MRGTRIGVLALTFVAACYSGNKKDAGSAVTGKGTPGVNYSVTVNRPTGGTVRSTDGQIVCGTAGSGADACGPVLFDWATKVTLGATVDPGYVFVSWGGDCKSDGSCLLDTSGFGADKYVVAVFGPDPMNGAIGHGDYTASAVHAPEYYKSAQWKASGVVLPPAGVRNCTACHGLDFNGQASAPSCNACHLANGAYAPPATGGLASFACSRCHGEMGMNADTSAYHHVMTKDVGADGIVYPTTNARITCTSCHVKHEISWGTKANNLRADIATVPTTGATTDAGICVSCHVQPQVKSEGQLDDATVTTATLDKTAYQASPHAYGVAGSFQGGGTFQVDCVKCHSSDASGSTLQDGANKFSLHTSADRRLRAKLGRAAPADDDDDGFCFRCHSTAADAIGGAKKATDANDWYGAVTTMAAGATNVYAQSQKGSTAKAPQPVSTSTLYFKPTGDESVSSAVIGLAGTSDSAVLATNTLYLSNSSAPEPVSNANILASSGTQSVSGSILYFQTSTATGVAVPQTGDTLAAGAQELRDMGVAPPTSSTTDSTTLGTTGTNRIIGVGSFVSPPMTQATTIPAGNLVVNVQGRKTGSGNNNATQVAAYARYYVYVWKADATKTVLAGPTTDTVALTNNNANRALTAALASPVTLGVGDRMAVDLEAQVTNTLTGGNVNYAVGQSYTNLTVPGTNTFSFVTTSGYTNTSFRNGSLAFSSGTSSSNRNANTTAGIVGWDRISQFTSPALAAPFTLKAGSAINLSLRAVQSAATNGCYVEYAAYRWTAADTQGEQLGLYLNGEAGAPNAIPFTTTAVNQTYTLTTASDVAFAAGDKVLIEVQVYRNPTTTGSCTVSYGGADQSSLALATSDGATPTYVQPIAGNTWVSRSMSPGAPTGIDQTVGSSETASSGSLTQYWKRASFVSPPVRTATTLAAAPWQINVWDSASNANVLANVRYRIFVWTAANAQGADILPWTTDGQITTTIAAQQVVNTAAGAAVPLAVGDRVVVELEVATSSATGGSATNQYKFGATSPSNLVLPSAVEFTYPEVTVAAWGRHDFAAYRGLHKPNPGEETPAYLGANKHVGCSDCHNPHAAGPTSHTVGTNLIAAGSPLTGVSGQVPTFDGPFTAATAYTAVTSATHEYEICFKCHSGANPNLAAWNAGWTDLAVAFNPANASAHPVVQANGSPGSGSTPLLATQMATGVALGKTMYCSDCHGNDDTAGTAAQGPHASAAKFILKGPNTQWPFQANGTTRWTWSNRTTAQGTKDGLFCWNCHSTTATNTGHSRSDHQSRACTQCHVLIPHGGKLGRLIVTPSAIAKGLGAYVDQGVCTSSSNCMSAFDRSAYTNPASIPESACAGCGEHSGGNGKTW